MYRRRREKRQHFIQNVIRWHPIILVLVMFMLGACTKSTAKGYTMPASTAVTALTTVEETKKTAVTTAATAPETEIQTDGIAIKENGNYTSKEEVALYLHTYNRLPSNYISKQDAEKLGWNSGKGNLSDVLPGRSIGGSVFGNYEGALPTAKGRKYYECDVDYKGGYRNAKRIIYSNDGLIFYTEDHYKTFEELY